MANFNLNDYETVEERLKRFWTDPANADARIVTINHTSPGDRQSGVWVIEARIYLDAGNHADDLPKVTGWAFEIDGQGMANRTAALENCETSAIGRALANLGLRGNKRASREEMAKVERGNRNWTVEIKATNDKAELRALYLDAQKAGAPKAVLDKIQQKAEIIAGQKT